MSNHNVDRQEVEIVRLDLTDNEEDEEEVRGLLRAGEETTMKNKRPAVQVSNRPVGAYVLRFLTLLLTGYILLRLLLLKSTQSHHHRNKHKVPFDPSIAHINTTWHDDSNRLVAVPYTCPSSIDRAKNDKDFIFDYYGRDTKRHANWNLTLNEILNMSKVY